MELKKELEENKIIDNPFDVMLYHSLQLTLDILFASHRFRNNKWGVFEKTDSRDIDKQTEKMKTEINKLMAISDEACDMCRHTAQFYATDKYNQLHDTLYNYQRQIEILMSKSNPVRNLEFEKFSLGENSEEYKHILELREKAKNFKDYDRETIGSIASIIEHGKKVIKWGWITEQDYNKYKSIVDKYNLTIDDIDYMYKYVVIQNRKEKTCSQI